MGSERMHGIPRAPRPQASAVQTSAFIPRAMPHCLPPYGPRRRNKAFNDLRCSVGAEYGAGIARDGARIAFALTQPLHLENRPLTNELQKLDVLRALGAFANNPKPACSARISHSDYYVYYSKSKSTRRPRLLRFNQLRRLLGALLAAGRFVRLMARMLPFSLLQ